MPLVAIIASSSLLLTNAAQVAESALKSEIGRTFSITGTVLAATSESLNVVDGSGAVRIMRLRSPEASAGVTAGDIVAVSGSTMDYDRGIVFPECRRCVRLGHAAAPDAVDVELCDIEDGRFDHRLVRIRGVLREVFRDEIEPSSIYMVISDGARPLYAAMAERSPDVLPVLQRLVGERITVTGISEPYTRSYRRQLGHLVLVRQELLGIRHEGPVHGDPFNVPQIEGLRHFDPSEIAAMGRRRTAGRVVAICSDGSFYLRDADGEVRHVRPTDCAQPRCGEFVEVAGFPVTDLYRINFSGAVWRPSEPQPVAEPAVRPTSIRKLLLDDMGRPKIYVARHGDIVRVTGTVLCVASAMDGHRTLMMSDAGTVMPVEVPAQADAVDIPVGSEVEATGVCIVNVGDYNPYSAFPHATGITLMARRPEDLRVLSRPPWWTPRRLSVALVALLVVLLALLFWNRLLNRIVERRSRRLAKEIAAHAASEMKVDERTRLAAELHDALSQTLTGISFQIDAANEARQKAPSQIGTYLDVARRSLRRCREDLRNCLWDLRNRALEERTVEGAVRRTLAQGFSGPKVEIDCRVPRNEISDDTLHAVLCILREAVANAVRHSGAKTISVAGALTADGKFVFSVSDDGAGFDPARSPGIGDGHFGIQGMAERAGRLGGELSVNSAPGKGTVVMLTFGQRQGGEGE